MRLAKWVTSAVMILTIPFMNGCWDRLEIEDRGAILGLAIDPLEKNTESITGPYAKGDAPGYKLTAQVAIPGRIPLGPGEIGPTGGQKPVWVIETTGKTIDDAMNNLQQDLADKVFLGHLRVIIVNQKLAMSQGLGDIQDFLRRNAEIRRLAWLMVSTDEAKDAMEAAPKLERVPALYLVGTMDHAVALGKLPNVYLGNYWSVESSKGQEAVLPLIAVEGKDRIATEGLAVFKDTRMVGSLNALETAAFMELTNQRQAGYGVSLPIPGDPKHSVVMKGSDRRTKVKFREDHGNLSIDTYTRIEANIQAKTGEKPLGPIFRDFGRESEIVLTKGQVDLIHKTQNWGTDIFGFGEYVRGHQPKYWLDNVQTRERWDKVFSKMTIRVHNRVIMRRAGMAAD